jgi:hypothetical protein
VAPTAIESPLYEEAPVRVSSYRPHINDEIAAWEVPTPETMADPEVIVEPAIEAQPEGSSWSHLSDANAVWDIAATDPELNAEPRDSESAVEEATSYMWRSSQPAKEAAELSYEAPAYDSPRIDLPAPMPQETSVQPVGEPEPAVVGGEVAPIEVSVSGRVQVTFSPVPDFDRLLNLDGALGRVSGVDSVTLADYAQEEVTFRVEVLGEKDAGLFMREIAAAAGIEATLIDVAGNGLVIRIN